jgi:hypothetical protein
MKIMYQLATLHGLYEALILTTESKNWTEAKNGTGCPGGMVYIVDSANRTEDRGFESHQGIRLLCDCNAVL